jgi:hypothetical protein
MRDRWFQGEVTVSGSLHRNGRDLRRDVFPGFLQLRIDAQPMHSSVAIVTLTVGLVHCHILLNGGFP